MDNIKILPAALEKMKKGNRSFVLYQECRGG